MYITTFVLVVVQGVTPFGEVGLGRGVLAVGLAVRGRLGPMIPFRPGGLTDRLTDLECLADKAQLSNRFLESPKGD